MSAEAEKVDEDQPAVRGFCLSWGLKALRTLFHILCIKLLYSRSPIAAIQQYLGYSIRTKDGMGSLAAGGVGNLYPPVFSTCPLHTNSGCGKERRILIGPW